MASQLVIGKEGAGIAPAPQTNDVHLALEGVEVAYRHSITALRGVTLSVRRGGIVAVLGSNGAGKSTTLRAVSNLLPALSGRVTAGRILFNGRDVQQFSPPGLVRQGLAQVLEGRHCFPSLTVEENLLTGIMGGGRGRRSRAEGLERIYSIFSRLRDKRKVPAGLTSGGEQQMTAIGRALLSGPELLVLDEPSMGLAPKAVQAIFEALRVLNRTEGLTILVAEQNSTVALRHADHAVVLETGRSVLAGPAQEIRERDDIRALYLGAAAGSEAPVLRA